MELMEIYQARSVPPPSSPPPRVLYEERPNPFTRPQGTISGGYESDHSPGWLIYGILCIFIIVSALGIFTFVKLLS